jgi:membrane protein implicated in regulation of membrane protease activity
MFSNALALATYLVRSAGLLIVGMMTAIAAWSSLFGDKPSIGVAACAALVMISTVLSWPRIPNAWRRDPPTGKQLEYAAKLGIDIPDGCSKGQLSDLISAAKADRDSF